jgi:hypothetical protein
MVLKKKKKIDGGKQRERERVCRQRNTLRFAGIFGSKETPTFSRATHTLSKCHADNRGQNLS